MSGVLKKPRALFLAVVVTATAFSLMFIALPSTSYATALRGPSVINHDLMGYNGNDTIYLTCGVGSSDHATYLSNDTSAGGKNTTCCYYNQEAVQNSLSIGMASNLTLNTRCTYQLEEHNTNGNEICVTIPVAASGTAFTPNIPSCSEAGDLTSIWGNNMSATLTGLENGTGYLCFELHRGLDSGGNISGQNSSTVDGTGVPAVLTAAGLALSTAALVSADFASLGTVGVALGVVGFISSMVPYTNSISSQNNALTPTLFSDGTLWQQSFVDNGTWTSDGSLGNFSNVFTTQEYLTLLIHKDNFANTGCLNLSTQNYMADLQDVHHNKFKSSTPGAASSLDIPILPAHTIQGVVTGSNGVGVPNQAVLVKQIVAEGATNSCVGFVVKTDSAGEYRFFAQPGCSYNISLCSDPNYHYCFTTSSAPSTQSETESSWANFSTYPVTFQESGLPTGTSWSVHLGGDIVTSTASSIEIAEPNGSYSYSIDNVTASSIQYDPTPSSSTVTVSGSGVAESISFNPVSIQFDASGLHGNTWSVTIGKLTESSSGASISLAKPIDTTYSYSIGIPSGYSADPSSGSVYLGSSSTSVSISFTPTAYYTVTFDESGLPSGYTWSVSIGGTTNSASTGSSIGFSEPNGYFSYSPSSLLIPYPGRPGYYYDYHAAGGTAHVNGASQSIDIAYSHIVVHYCVNATTEILLANGSYEQAQYIGTGTDIMTYNITTESMQQEMVQSVLSVNESSLYTINGNLQVSGDQPILTNHGWIAASNLHVGERIFDPLNGTYVTINSMHLSQGTYTMYDFILSGNNDFIAYTCLLQGVSS